MVNVEIHLMAVLEVEFLMEIVSQHDLEDNSWEAEQMFCISIEGSKISKWMIV